MSVFGAQLPFSSPMETPLTYSPAANRTVKILIVAVVTLVTSMEFLTSYAVAVALPDIQGDLAASLDEGSWIITTYITCFLFSLLLSNWLSARIGYRRYTIMAVIVFMLSSVGCGLSHTLAQMLVLRGIMGFAAGGFLARGQAAVYLIYTGKARAVALSVFAFGVVALARTFAPAVGGYLTEWYSWRYIFLLNLPLSLTALVLLVSFLPDVKAKDDNPRLDILGLILLVGWVAPLQIVLSRGERDDWFADSFICAMTVTAVGCGLLFIWWELRPENTHPIISYRAYQSRNFVVGSIFVVVIGMMLYGQLYFVPQFLRGVQHHSAWGVGELETIDAAAFAVGLYIGGLLMKRIGLRTLLGIGAAVFAAGMVLWSIRVTPWIPDSEMYLPLALTGFGAGWEIGPISTLINSQTPAPLLGESMQLYLFQRQIGGSWGIAILTIIADRQWSFWSSRLGESVNSYSLMTQDALHQGSAALGWAGLPAGQADAAALALLHARLTLQSAVNAFVDTFQYQAALGAAAFLLVLFFARWPTRPKQAKRPHQPGGVPQSPRRRMGEP
jgi:DHA2 family multidrug resistance protein